MRQIFIVMTAAVFAASCTGSQATTEVTENISSRETPAEERAYPAWYFSDGFEADSAGYSMSHSAAASDSAAAVQRAEKVSRMLLETNLANLLERARNDIQRQAENAVKEPGFIVALRNAHAPIETEAQVINSTGEAGEHGYIGYAKVGISRSGLKNLLEKGFAGNKAYWQLLSSHKSFTDLVD